MADSSRNLESILAALAAQRPPSSTPTQGQPGLSAPNYPAPNAQSAYASGPPGAAPPHSYVPPPGNYHYPPPASSSGLDLSDIKPVNSGTVSIQDAIAKAKAFAAGNGVAPYERPPTYAPVDARGGDGRQYGAPRSRSPPGRHDAFRDNFNPYRDERRDDRGHGYTRERSFSPGPRGRQGGGSFSPRANPSVRERSPLRVGDNNSETIQIESSLVGLIIGRQGENLRRVEADSSCRVQFLPATSPDDQFRQCRITGPASSRAEAKAAINRIIEDSGMGAIARAGLDSGGGGAGSRTEGGRGGPPAPKDGEETMQIMVPDRTVGLIIGRGGETIRDLQERSGCHVNIVGESKSVNGLRPVNLIGSPAAAARAKDMIMEIVDSDTRNPGNQQQQHTGRSGNNFREPGGPDKITDSMFVPSEAVGMIIGKGGETIREMQNSTGCKINVSQSSGPGEVEREIGLIGNPDAISRAKRAIEDKVDAVRQKNAGGGGRGGRGGHRDYDSPSYGHQASNQTTASNPPAVPAPAGNGQADPYAAYGGYNAYVALWYQALAAQQAANQGDQSKPPGAP